jgi:hypothetical protein
MVSRERIRENVKTEKNAQKRRWLWRAAVVFGVFVVLGAAAFRYVRGRNSPPIPAAGGAPFTNFSTIKTPHYLQRDPRWESDTIGGGETLGKVGCTVSSLAMALEYYGLSFTPQTLNAALKAHGGYTQRGWLLWSAVAKVTDGKVQVRVLANPTHDDIDSALRAGEPVLAKIFINRVIPHWVLVAGKDGTEYLMRDPLNDTMTLTPLASYGSDVYGVRIVERTKL